MQVFNFMDILNVSALKLSLRVVEHQRLLILKQKREDKFTHALVHS